MWGCLSSLRVHLQKPDFLGKMNPYVNKLSHQAVLILFNVDILTTGPICSGNIIFVYAQILIKCICLIRPHLHYSHKCNYITSLPFFFNWKSYSVSEGNSLIKVLGF